MDDIAEAAHVGKATLFRAFESRDGLLDQLFLRRIARLQQAFTSGPPPLGPGGSPSDRAFAVLDAFLVFKLDNRSLIRARQTSTRSPTEAVEYRWVHEVVSHLLQEAAPLDSTESAFAAHALLGALRPAVLDSLLESGETPTSIRRAQRNTIARLVGEHGGRPPTRQASPSLRPPGSAGPRTAS